MCRLPDCLRFFAFYQEQTDRAGIEAYLDGIEREALLYDFGKPVDTYFLEGARLDCSKKKI